MPRWSPLQKIHSLNQQPLPSFPHSSHYPEGRRYERKFVPAHRRTATVQKMQTKNLGHRTLLNQAGKNSKQTHTGQHTSPVVHTLPSSDKIIFKKLFGARRGAGSPYLAKQRQNKFPKNKLARGAVQRTHTLPSSGKINSKKINRREARRRQPVRCQAATK